MVAQSPEQGDAMGQSMLGLRYAEGRGVPQSKYVAGDWMYKAGLSYLKKGERDQAIIMLETIEITVPGHILTKKLTEKIYGEKSKTNKDK